MGKGNFKIGIGINGKYRSGGSRPHISSGHPLTSLHCHFGVSHYGSHFTGYLKSEGTLHSHLADGYPADILDTRQTSWITGDLLPGYVYT